MVLNCPVCAVWDGTLDRSTARRVAALRALVTELATRTDKLHKEQDIQFRRIAQMQQDIDEIKRLLKKLTRPEGKD